MSGFFYKSKKKTMRRKKFWLLESNRMKHLIGGFFVGLIFTFFGALGCAGALEFKDCHFYNGNKEFDEWKWENWDWKDFIATMIGGVVGGTINFFLIYLFFQWKIVIVPASYIVG